MSATWLRPLLGVCARCDPDIIGVSTEAELFAWLGKGVSGCLRAVACCAFSGFDGEAASLAELEGPED